MESLNEPLEKFLEKSLLSLEMIFQEECRKNPRNSSWNTESVFEDISERVSGETSE